MKQVNAFLRPHVNLKANENFHKIHLFTEKSRLLFEVLFYIVITCCMLHAGLLLPLNVITSLNSQSSILNVREEVIRVRGPAGHVLLHNTF